MCGIHLIWGKGAKEESIQGLLNESRHRGPDQEASFSPWPGLWLGVNRLKILHPGPDADQPFWAPDGRSMIIWNGEIYNYQDLRNLLQKMGVEFVTHSDTEVLTHWLRIFGAKGLEKLQGMFALIYVDLSNQTVLVARDKNGEKPLYYHQNQDRLIISSESRGIGKLAKSKLDKSQLEYYYYMRTPLQGKTFFKGVKEWKPSRFSLIRQHSAFRWDNIPSLPSAQQEISKNRLQELLLDAVLKQFHADVPVGMLLSGGIDSTLLYSLWYQETGVPLHTFTIAHEAAYSNKYGDAEAVKKQGKTLPSENHLIQVDQTIFWENWEEYLRTLDLPIGDSASFLTWLIGKEAKKHVKVLASGAGADELWGGYQRHQAFDFYWRRKDWLLRLKPLLLKLPLNRNWQKFLTGIEENPKRTFMNFSALESLQEDLFSDHERIFDERLSSYKQMLDFDRRVYLVQDVLKIQDNALMAHGIEGRSPYLDEGVIQFWKEIKSDELLLGKKWLRQILKDRGLSWVGNRKKTGFGLPLLEWFSEKGEFRERVFQELATFKKDYQDILPKVTNELLEKPENHVKSHFLTLYNLFLLAEWLKIQKL